MSNETEKGLAVVSTVMNIQTSQNAENFVIT
jgi:hypothetical protein